MEELSKRERKERAREERALAQVQLQKVSIMKKYRLWLVVLLVLCGLGYWIYKGLNQPLPGQLFPDLGRDHINDISNFQYNSNPPTSGPHFPVWAKKGIYDRIVSDGYLVHSLEHGYIVISYDCTKKLSSDNLRIRTAYAQDETPSSTESGKPLTKMTVFPTDKMSWITPDSPPGVEVDLPHEFNSDSCKSLVKDLSQFLPEWDRIVIVPRLNMDHPIALTAWRRLLALDSVDKGKIEEFIKTFHNMGPEKTME